MPQWYFRGVFTTFQISKMELFEKAIDCFWKKLYLRCLTGSEYVSGLQHILRHSKDVFLVILLLTLTDLHKNVFRDLMRPSQNFSLHWKMIRIKFWLGFFHGFVKIVVVVVVVVVVVGGVIGCKPFFITRTIVINENENFLQSAFERILKAKTY